MELSRHKFKAVISITLAIFVGLISATDDDLPCAALSFTNRSVVCVCNSTYCDTINRVAPSSGEYVTYVSTYSGQRFNKTTESFSTWGSSSSRVTLTLYPTITYQTIEGFGGAITDSAAINWDNLEDETLKQYFIDSYSSDAGIQYNMLRVPIGGTDFSTRGYAYNDLPEDDSSLGNFTLATEDYNYKIPMIKACMEAASADIEIISTVWSPPKWMKSNNEYTGISYLKEEYMQTYADYYVKFLEAYKAEGIDIWGVSTTNEPLTSISNMSDINSLGWTIQGMGSWIIDYFGPTLRAYDSDLKLLAVDDMRFAIPAWFNWIVLRWPAALEYIDGIAVHYYADAYVPPEMLTKTKENYPDIFVISTEACTGTLNPTGVSFGAWDRAERYANDIIEDLRYNLTGWLDWNVCLNTDGGPSWVNGAVDSPVIVLPDEGVFYKQPMFYAMGHFSKFIPRGSNRILSVDSSSSLNHVAVVTPLNTTVVVFLNKESSEIDVTINLGLNQANVVLEAQSITTVELYYDGTTCDSYE